MAIQSGTLSFTIKVIVKKFWRPALYVCMLLITCYNIQFIANIASSKRYKAVIYLHDLQLQSFVKFWENFSDGRAVKDPLGLRRLIGCDESLPR
jgi:hypothetical protein